MYKRKELPFTAETVFNGLTVARLLCLAADELVFMSEANLPVPNVAGKAAKIVESLEKANAMSRMEALVWLHSAPDRFCNLDKRKRNELTTKKNGDHK